MVEAKIDTDKKILFILILILLIGGIFGTYSYFTAQDTTDKQNINTANLSLAFADGSSIINNNFIKPIKDEMIFEQATKKTFTLQNLSDIPVVAKIDLSIIQISEELKDPDFRWALYEGSNKINSNTFEVITENKINIISDLSLDKESSKTYDLYIWISYDENNPQNHMQDKSLNATIEANAVQQ